MIKQENFKKEKKKRLFLLIKRNPSYSSSNKYQLSFNVTDCCCFLNIYIYIYIYIIIIINLPCLAYFRRYSVEACSFLAFLDVTETHGVIARWAPHENGTRLFWTNPEATLYKQQLNGHSPFFLTIYPSKTKKTCRTHRPQSLMNSDTEMWQCWLSSQDIYASALFRHWILSRVPARCDGRWR